MAPNGLAILIGAGPTSGAGIARILAHPSHGNMAVALLARNPNNLHTLTQNLRAALPAGVILHAFPTDTEPSNLSRAFSAIQAHPDLSSLKLRLAVYHVKHASKMPLLKETAEEFGESLQTYTTGAFAFAREAVKTMYAQSGGETSLAETAGRKKGTIIFTGTLGALRTNAEFSSYGAGRAGARMVAQGVGKEVSAKGIHVVHAIANGAIRDEESEGSKTGVFMRAESVGKAYLWLEGLEPDLWIDELDLRPAQEKF